MNSYFAVTSPGLEPITAQELRQLNLLSLQVEPGGVLFKGDLADLYRANLHLRTASRILARLGNYFHASTSVELRERLAHLPWERFLTPGQPVHLRVTCHKSRLYHSGQVARAVSVALEQRLGTTTPVVEAGGDSSQPPQLVVIRLAEDICTVSVDSSGVLLHKRGYRLAVSRAPLRETLAAALLMASGWDLASPLLDPFCGSGTIPIEAACMALGILPGSDRRFAFMDWPGYDDTLWQTIREQKPVIPARSIEIFASDRDAGAIEMARANARRAGVLDAIEFKCQAVSSISPPAKPGWVVTNPPYGPRLSEGKDLRNLYAQFGNVLRVKCPGWNLAVLSTHFALFGQMQVQFDTSLKMRNGGLRVMLGKGKVPAN